MELPDSLLLPIFAAISLLSAAAGVVLTSNLQRIALRRTARDAASQGDAPAIRTGDAAVAPALVEPRVYSFQHGSLLTKIGADDPFLAPDIDASFAYTALREGLAGLHRDIPARMDGLMRRGEPFFLLGHMGPDVISVAGRPAGETLLVSLAPAEEAGGCRLVETRSLDAALSEVARLRIASMQAGVLQWTEAGDGRVVWANAAYLGLVDLLWTGGEGAATWPLPRAFGRQLDPPPPEGRARRCKVDLPDRARPLHFEVEARQSPDGTVSYSAHRIDRLIDAETGLRDFVQTLSKTFADLPTGLAVFDRNRNLILFNPALVSISTLSPSYLSGRPSLSAFLDQLREMRRMPEPRDYRGWRDAIARLERGAEAGRYHELWTLPGGESLRVTGRPHADGGLAFMFEDISKEISLTRRFRADRDLDKAILDDADVAFAVFDREGRVLRANATYAQLLSADPEAVEAGGLAGAVRSWQAAFHPSGLWGDIRQFVFHEGDRAGWEEPVTTRDGQEVLCRVAPLRGGHCIVWFRAIGESLIVPPLDRGDTGPDVEDAGFRGASERDAGAA